MRVKECRLKQGWSQEQLAEMSGLSVRTIQRIEQGKEPSLDSLKSLAAVFNLDVSELHIKTDMDLIREQVKELKGFYLHLVICLTVSVLLFVVNYVLDPTYIWAWWAVLGWGIGLVAHGISISEWFGTFGTKWEQREVNKRLKKNSV
ncbi:2TM domain-containing protein [Vibrio vulnificus]